MNKTHIAFVLVLLSALPAGLVAAAETAAASTPATLAVTVTNHLAAARTHETVTIDVAAATKHLPGFAPKKTLVTDTAGKEVLSQLVDSNGDDVPEQIVFQTDLRAKESKTFKLTPGERQPAKRDDYKVYGRFVRERHDDFAWENDRIAHRMYGPDLETCAKEPLTSSGVDVWVKRVPKLIINDWYMTGDYHRDTGEGADFYGVGKSRGLGGIGVWSGGKLHVSGNFVQSRVLASGPIRLVFELTYKTWEAGSERVTETKRVTLDAGSHWNRCASTFAGQHGALMAGIGIAKHAGSEVKVDKKDGTMRVWEPLDGGKAGNLGTAIGLPTGAKLEEHHGDLDYLLVTRVPSNGTLVYYTASAWDRAGALANQTAWAAEVQAFARKLAHPVQVKLTVAR